MVCDSFFWAILIALQVEKSMTRVVVIMSVYMQDDLAYLSESLESLYVQNFHFDIFIQCDGPLKKDMMVFEQQLKHEKLFLAKEK